jgi:hypothetical protein
MNITTITKLYTIFTNKRWTDNDGNEVVFTNFCKLLSNLNESQRQLIIDLAERYTWITFGEYSGRLIKVLNYIEQEKLTTIRRIILFPIMKPEDEAKTKSGHNILYMLKAIKPLLPNYRAINFVEIETYEVFKNTDFRIKDDEIMFLLDDYLGSGETIRTTIEEILKNRNIEPNQLNVVSIAAQKESIEFLKEIGISVYTDLVSSKGISDYYQSPDLDEKIAIMKDIERLIPVRHFSFGYNQSEALITLIRTPDNTFPIFWKEHKKNNEIFEAPFSRY